MIPESSASYVKPRFRLFAFCSSLVWTLAILGSLVWNERSERQLIVSNATMIAKSEFRRDVVYRKWNTTNNGVYVRTSDRTRPNPYLSFLEDRDVIVAPGDTLTLVNPAYMTRKVHEFGRVVTDMRGHITSLNPIRPENSPDPWEHIALEKFEQGVTSVAEVDTLEGRRYLRYMEPLVTDPECMKCHARQGYKIGQIRGGISVSILMAPYEAIGRSRMRSVLFGHAGFWLLGLIAINLLIYFLSKKDKLAREAIEQKFELERIAMGAQKMESLGLMASGVAHDFNNKLSIIFGNLELAMLTMNPESHPYEELKQIEKATLESRDMIQQLLGFARKQEVVPTVVDINTLVDSSLNMLERLLGSRIHVSWAPGEDLWRIKFDPTQFDQIMTNLLINARDAMEGAGKINVWSENAYVEETISSGITEVEPGHYVMIAIQDTGSGIPDDVLQIMFEPFFTTKEAGKGTGLGLATAYGIVKQNKGFVTVETELRKGTTFFIYLPPCEDGVHAGEPRTMRERAAS